MNKANIGVGLRTDFSCGVRKLLAYPTGPALTPTLGNRSRRCPTSRSKGRQTTGSRHETATVFIFSDNGQARTAAADLAGLGVDPGHMHVHARPGTDLDGLPPAIGPQQRDVLKRLEKTLWGGNLALFGIAFAGLVLAALFNSVIGMVLAVAVMIVSFVRGALFALRLPMTHLDEFHEELRHGELLLMVDVSRDCVEDVEELMRRRHPEAVTGGSAWTPDAFGV